LSQDNQVQAFYEGLDNSNKNLVDSACGGVLMEKSSEEVIELFETLSENSHQKGGMYQKVRVFMR
jgi:hypothetical protein